MADKVFDCAIVGAGVAGMTSAIYLARADKSVAIIDKEGFGGNIAKSPKVANIPGFPSISGADFAANMYEQMTAYSNVEHFIEEVALIKYNHGMFILITDNNETICSKSLIIATGTTPKKLKVDTKDVYFCVTCDGPFFKDKNVLVVGSGNTGAAYALELATYCKNVYICDITSEMGCEPASRKLIEETKNIQWLPNCSIKSVTNVKTTGNLKSVTLSTLAEINCNAIFAAIGMDPNTDIAKGLAGFDANKFIDVDANCSCKLVPGLYAAGDCVHKSVRQVTTAANDGTIAAVNVIKFLNGGH